MEKTFWRRLSVVAALAAMCASVAYAADPFSYSDNFNGYTHGAPAAGWQANGPHAPSVFTSDSDPADNDPAWDSIALLGGSAIQDYNAAWSGGGRFTLIHPVQQPPASADAGYAASAWYEGTGGPHTGTYPLELTTQSLKAEFDLLIRSGWQNGNNAWCGGHPADGSVFAIMPVKTSLADAVRAIGIGGGGMSWASLDGFAVEFDIWDNGAANDPACPDCDNHIGLDVFARWTNGDQLPSVATNVTVQSLSDKMWNISDANQPMHFTLYYNDPAEGGIGWVRVYLKIDPQYGPYSFGMDGDPRGKLILDACVGAWPQEYPTAVFGLTGAIGGCNGITQVDNLAVATTNLQGGSACTPPNVPPANLPATVALNKGSKVAGCDAGLAEAGWDMKVYSPMSNFNNTIGFAAYAMATAEVNGSVAASETQVVNINYEDNGGCGGYFGGNRQIPGLFNADNYGVMFKGWVCFPQAKKYYFNVTSDDGFAMVIGAGSAAQVVGWFDGGRGCDAGTNFGVEVQEAGVYAIQLITWEGGGGAGVEMHRILPPPENQLILGYNRILVGSTAPEAVPDHPIIYGTLDGMRAPTDFLASIPYEGVNVLASQRIAGAQPAGEQMFNYKAVTAPIGHWMGHEWDGDRAKVSQRMIESLPALGPATVVGINFADQETDGTNWWWQEDGRIPDNTTYPGIDPVVLPATGHRDQFGMKAWGYAEFPAAGRYYVWLRSDDDFTLKLGNQTLYSGIWPQYEALPLNIAEAGIYPIYIDHTEDGGWAYVEFGEATNAEGLKVFNTQTNSVKVWTDAIIPADVTPTMPEPMGVRIPASRKVADLGQEGEMGWNAVLSKLPAGIGMQESNAFASATIENDLIGLGTGLCWQGTDTPLVVNYADHGDDGITRMSGWFNSGDPNSLNADRDVKVFDPAGTNLPTGEVNDFALMASGYILFPEAGPYAITVNGDDGGSLWIGGVQVTVHWWWTGPVDYSFRSIWVDEPGLYDIRAEIFEGGGGSAMEVHQYLNASGDGTSNGRVLLNAPGSTAKVYRTLAEGVTPATTKYHNPVRLPASAAAAGINDGADQGLRVQVVNSTFNVSGYGDWDWDRDMHRTHVHGTETLDAVLLGMPSLNQQGVLTSDTIEPIVDFGDNTFPKMTSGDPPRTNEEDFNVRVSGYLALTKGGHIFSVSSDDGYRMWIGGTIPHLDGVELGESGPLKGANDKYVYVLAEADGLYKFEIDMLERGGGEDLHFRERLFAQGDALVLVNDGNNSDVTKVYQTVKPCPKPFADGDRDGDVDQEDFGLFQACFTGDDTNVTEACQCFDKDKSSSVDSVDLAAFESCATGPAMPADPGCGQ